MDIKVGVIGAGSWGRNLVRVLSELDALALVADSSPARRAETEDRYPGIRVVEGFDEALASDCRALVISTPAESHYRMTRRALEAGKDVFVEKPFAFSVTDARALATLADERESVLMIGHVLLYQPAMSWIRDYLASGEPGTIRHVSTRRARLGRVIDGEDVWWSLGPHDISVVIDLLGTSEVETISATGHAMLRRHVVDNVNAALKFRSGQTAHIHCSWYWPLDERRTTILAERRIIVYDESGQTVTVYDKGVDRELNDRDNGSFVAEIGAGEPLKRECEHFLECVERRERPRSDGWNGVAVTGILERAAEQFGNGWLARAQRSARG